MMEAGVVLDTNDRPLYWHLPNNRSVGALPDSRALWDVLWDAHQRGVLRGFAHTHPGSGVPGPSHEDITTFKAIENALGRPVEWWIATSNGLIKVWTSLNGQMLPGTDVFSSVDLEGNQSFRMRTLWLDELRKHSNY